MKLIWMLVWILFLFILVVIINFYGVDCRLLIFDFSKLCNSVLHLIINLLFASCWLSMMVSTSLSCGMSMFSLSLFYMMWKKGEYKIMRYQNVCGMNKSIIQHLFSMLSNSGPLLFIFLNIKHFLCWAYKPEKMWWPLYKLFYA